MSEPEFEHWLRLLGRLLDLSDAQRDNVRRELRDHLETQLADLMARGFSREEAVARALDEFGDAAALGRDLSRLNVRRRWIMRSTIGLGVAAAAAVVVSLFLPVDPESSRTATGQETAATVEAVPDAPEFASPADRRTRTQLSQAIDRLELEDISLENVITYLRETSGLNMHVHWRVLEAAGIEREQPITLHLTNVPLGKAIDLILDDVSGGEVALGYEVDEGIVRLSTIDDFDRRTDTVVYRIGDLIAPALSEAQKIALRNIVTSVSTLRTGHSENLSSDQIEKRLDEMVDTIQTILETRRGDRLTEMIRETISSDSWRGNGGDAGSIHLWHGRIVVTHSKRIHRRIQELLEQLRRTESPVS